MKKYVIFFTGILFTACMHGGSSDNPLVESRRAEGLADTLANLIIQKDPITKEKGMIEKINNEIAATKTHLIEVQEQMSTGFRGAILSIQEDAHGYVLYLDDTLYFSSDFDADPGINLHAYLTTSVDPREGKFPDTTALDLGKMSIPYGAQSFAVPHQKRPELYRTFVLFDITLKRLYGFAQLSR